MPGAENNEPASRPLAVVFTDLVDSTAIATRVGDAAMNSAWALHDRLSRELMRRWSGREIGRSDGFLVVFGGAPEAVGFAVAYHRLVEALPVPLSARIGIHVGPVTLRRNRQEDLLHGATPYEIDGVAVPIASRIMSIARAGQTLLSASAARSLGGEERGMVGHGHWRVKGIEEPIELFEFGDENAEHLPPEDGDKAYRVVRRDEDWLPVRAIRHSVPAERDTFVGRGAAMGQLANRFEQGARLVSVLGIGGIGKTRLATRFAKAWLGEFPGGAWFCDVSQARTLDGIFFAVAQGLDVPLGKFDPRLQLSEAIRGHGRCLVLLDNFEQVVRHAPETLGFWLECAPEAKFVVTTRERLGLPGESVLWLETLNRTEAISLLALRARAVLPEGEQLAEDDAAAGKLVELLDGLPLAIELAAARLGVMTPAILLTRLGKRFEMLASREGRLERQATLRAAFDWSWDLLAPHEQGALAQSSVFSGGFSLDSAEAVLALADHEAPEAVCDTVQSLVDKSFVRRGAAGRFYLLESVREYAAQKLDRLSGGASTATTQAQIRHGEHFSHFPLTKTRQDALEAENIVAACRRAVARGDAEIAVRACANAWSILSARGPYRVCLELIGSALAMPSLADRHATELLNMHGRCLLVCGKSGQARVQLDSALERARRESSLRDEVAALSCLAELNVIEGRMHEAKEQYEEAIRRAADIDDAAYLCAALNGLGTYFNRTGKLKEAREMFQRALDAARIAGDRRWQGGAMSNLGQIAANIGNRATAKEFYQQAISLAQDIGDRVWEGNLLCNSGLLSLEEGSKDAAEVALSASLSLARDTGHLLLESVVLCNLGLLYESLGDDQRASDAYAAALAVARRREDKRTMGQFLGYLGSLLAKQGGVEEGRTSLIQAMALLHEVGDAISHAIVLCRYAQSSHLWDDGTGGRANLEEAMRVAADIGVESSSELAIAIAQARRSLDAVTSRPLN